MTFLFRRAIHFVRKTMPPPDRWEAYSPMGKVIPGTKFLAFKVPLKEELLKQVEEKDRFSPAILMKLLGDQGHKLGAVIDLTFTYKYYNSEEFVKNSIEHKKVFTPGHNVPSESVFQQFAHAVKKFDTGDNDHIIGVHCTHGVNRTGYLICRYMIEEMSYEPEVAISLFDEARGHKLERENYLEDLKTRKCGQSTYDPNFKVPDEEVRPGGYQGPRKEKSRWRHRREGHSGSRRKYHDSAEMRGMRAVPGPYTLPRDHLRLPYPEDPGFIQRGNGSAYNSFSRGTDYSSGVPVCPMPGRYLEEGGSSEDRSIPDHFDPSGRNNSYPISRSIQDYINTCWNNADRDGYNPSGTGRGQRRGNYSNYLNHRFNPFYSYGGPGANRDKADERRHHRNNDSVNPEMKDTKS